MFHRILPLCLASIASVAAAQQPASPVIVVLESDDARVSAGAVRGAMTEAGLPAISLLDQRARVAQGTLTIAVSEDGHTAQAHYAPRDGSALVRFLRAGRRADVRGRWMVPALVAMVRSVRPRDPLRFTDVAVSEVLDPWEGNGHPDPTLVTVDRVPTVEVIDPWGRDREYVAHADHRRAYRITTEVLDPWGTARPASKRASYSRGRARGRRSLGKRSQKRACRWAKPAPTSAAVR